MIRSELFDQAIGELPPSRVDVAAIVARQERRKAARRGVVALLGVAALVCTIAVGIGLKGQSRIGRSAVLPAAAPSKSTFSESPEAKAARVQAAWLRATAKVLPGAAWRAGHDGSLVTPSRADYYDEVADPTPPPMFTLTNDLDRIGDNPIDMSQWRTSDRLYHTFGIVKVGANEGRFTIRTVWRASPSYRNNSACSAKSDGVFTCGDDLVCTQGAVCGQTAGPHGEVIFTTRKTEHLKEYRLPYNMLWVWMRSADGTRTIEMTIENRAGGDSGPEPATTEPALTSEQMVGIMLEPGLMI